MYNLDDPNAKIEMGDTHPILFVLNALLEDEFVGSYENKVKFVETVLVDSYLPDDKWVALFLLAKFSAYYFDILFKETEKFRQETLRQIYFSDESDYIKRYKKLKREILKEEIDVEYCSSPAPLEDKSVDMPYDDLESIFEKDILAARLVELANDENEWRIALMIDDVFNGEKVIKKVKREQKKRPR